MSRTHIHLKRLSFMILLMWTSGLYAAPPCLGTDCSSDPWQEMRKGVSKKSAIHTTVNEIVTSPDQFDGIKVEVIGRIVSIERRASRNGNFYLEVTISEFNSNPRQTENQIKVYAFMWPRLTKGDAIVIEGKYHVDYWFGGWPSENFIDAEVVKRGSAL